MYCPVKGRKRVTMIFARSDFHYETCNPARGRKKEIVLVRHNTNTSNQLGRTPRGDGNIWNSMQEREAILVMNQATPRGDGKSQKLVV